MYRTKAREGLRRVHRTGMATVTACRARAWQTRSSRHASSSEIWLTARTAERARLGGDTLETTVLRRGWHFALTPRGCLHKQASSAKAGGAVYVRIGTARPGISRLGARLGMEAYSSPLNCSEPTSSRAFNASTGYPGTNPLPRLCEVDVAPQQ